MESELAALEKYLAQIHSAPAGTSTTVSGLLHRLIELRGTHDGAACPGLNAVEEERLPDFEEWKQHGDSVIRLGEVLGDLGAEPVFARHPLRWLGEVWELYGGTVAASLVLALLCVLGNLLIGIPCAYALARSRSRMARVFEELLTLPVAVPGLATALALILAYGQISGFRQSFAFILVGHMVFTLPFMVRTVSSAFQRPELHSLEEAARSLGAGFMQRFMGVLLPAVLPAIVAGRVVAPGRAPIALKSAWSSTAPKRTRRSWGCVSMASMTEVLALCGA